MPSIFYPPPMPQNSSPPQIKLPILPLVQVFTPVGTRNTQILVIEQTWIPPYFQRPTGIHDASNVVTLTPPPAGNQDFPPFTFREENQEILSQWWTVLVPSPVQKGKLNPQILTPDLPTKFRDKEYIDIIVRSFYENENRNNLGSLYSRQQKRFYLYDNPPIVPPVQIGGFIAFQPNAFQVEYPGKLVAFQGRNRVLSVRHLAVGFWLQIQLYINGEITVQRHELGDAIVISCKIYDPTEVPAKLFDPDTVKLDLYNPNGTSKLNQILMNRIDIGNYSYIHQTIPTDQVGVYEISITGQNATNQAKTIKQSAFRLVS